MNYSSEVEDDDDENRAFYLDEYFEVIKSSQVRHNIDCVSVTLFQFIRILRNSEKSSVLLLQYYRILRNFTMEYAAIALDKMR